jgi:hypothetical protein
MGAKTASDGRTSLGAYVTGLREGSVCFCCGRGIMHKGEKVASRRRDSSVQPLVCSVCGSEVVDGDDSTEAEPVGWNHSVEPWARRTAA